MQVTFAIGEGRVEKYELECPPREGEKVQLKDGDQIVMHRVESVEWELYDDEAIVSIGLEEIGRM